MLPRRLFPSLLVMSVMVIARRVGVIKVGTTFPPDLKRKIGPTTALETCPWKHPYALDGGRQSCRLPVKRDDPALAADCDGGRVWRGSSPQCCMGEGTTRPCADSRGCKDYPVSLCPSPTIDSYSSIYGNDLAAFNIDYVLTFVQCEKYGNFWLPNNGEAGWFVVDFGCNAAFDRVSLRQTRDYGANRKGTENFTLSTSFDKTSWTPILSGRLDDAKNLPLCELPTTHFDVFGYGRYFKFTCLSYYPVGGGLNYIGWRFLLGDN